MTITNRFMQSCSLRLTVALLAALVVFGSNTASASELDRAALIEGAKKEGKLVWYSGAPQTIVTTMLSAFKEKYPFIDTSEFVSSSAGRILARLRSESSAGRHIADVVESGDLALPLLIKDMVGDFEAPEQAAYPDQFKVKGKWTAWKMATLQLGYNTSKMGSGDIPNTWMALADPKFAGKVALRNSSSGLMFFQWYVLRQTMGPDFWNKVLKNKPVRFAATTPMNEAILRGELKLNGSTTSFSLWQYRQQKTGAPYAGIVPKEGVPTAMYPMFVLKDSPHPNAARLFVDWCLSEEGQTVMVQKVGDYSARPGIAVPEGNADLSSMTLLTPDSVNKFSSAKNDFLKEWKAKK